MIKKKAYNLLDFTWDEAVEVEVETLQRAGSTGASVHRQGYVASGPSAHLPV